MWIVRWFWLAFGWSRGWWKMRKDRAQCKIDPSKQKISFNNFDTWPSGANMSPLHKNITRSHHESANFSLVGDLEFPPNCNPNRPYPGLWNYEVPISSYCQHSWPDRQTILRWWKHSSSTRWASAMSSSSSILVEPILLSSSIQSMMIWSLVRWGYLDRMMNIYHLGASVVHINFS